MSYTKTTWRNNQAPAINADNLNHMEQGIESAHNQIDVNTSNIESLTTQVQNNATNIASEISARQTTDSSLQSQIDQLVAPTGEAPTPAEIENARIGDDGVTYDTLGNAIRGQFSDLKSEISYPAKAILDIRENAIVGFLNGSGQVLSKYTAYRTSLYIGVKNGDAFTYKIKTASGSSAIAFYSSPSEASFVSKVTGDETVQSGIYTAPADGYIRVGWMNSFASDLMFYLSNNTPAIISESIDATTAELKNYTDKSSADVYKKVYAIKTNNLQDGFINGSGSFVSHSNYRTTDYLPIKTGETFSYRLSHGAALPIISFYDESKAYSSTKSVIGVSGYSEGVYTATANGFIRFTYLNLNSDVNVIFAPAIPDNIRKYYPNNGVSSLNILCLGDSIFGEDDDITNALSELSLATVINGAVAGSRATNRGITYPTDNFQYFDGVNLIQALCTNTWTEQEAAVEALKTSYPWFPAKLATLKSIDMSNIDLITFNWATNDYTGGVSMADIVSAHNAIIDRILTDYPTMRIIVISPIWRYFGQPSDNKNADNFAYNVNTLKEISNAIVANAHDKRITVFDAYKNIPLNYKTATTYFNADSGVHLNATGGKLFAHYLNGFINSVY